MPQYIDPASGQPIQPVMTLGNDAKGHGTLSVGGTVASLSSIPAGATRATMTNETVQIRYWVDGTSPTTTAGHLVNAGDTIKLDSAGQLNNFKAIAVSGTATLQITYF